MNWLKLTQLQQILENEHVQNQMIYYMNDRLLHKIMQKHHDSIMKNTIDNKTIISICL